MGNCLKTQLKSEVNNSNLTKLGVINIHIIPRESPTENQSKLALKASAGSPITVKTADGNKHFALSFAGLQNPSSMLSEYTINETIKTLYFENSTYDIEIHNKYGLEQFLETGGTSPISIIYGSIDNFTYTISGQTIIINTNNNWEGNLSSFENLNYTYINIQSRLVEGNVASLGTLVNLTRLQLVESNGKMTGSIEEFVATQVNKGRQSLAYDNAIATNILHNEKITFGGNTYSESYGKLTWESASKIAVYCANSASGDYNRVYCKGYTQSEAEEAFPGKTITRVDA